jgi:hypothetical protein
VNRHKAKPYSPEPGVVECHICGGETTGEGDAATHVDESRNPSAPVPVPERARARTDDPAESHEAAGTVTMRSTHRAVLALLKTYPEGLSDEELVEAYTDEQGHDGYLPQTASGIRSRRAELAAAGHVIETGEHRRTVAGRKTRVWTVNPESEGL